jgi:hypothetical protein
MVWAATPRARLQCQNAPRDAKIRIGRNHINVIGLDPEIVGDLMDRHRSGPLQKLCEHAFMLRIKVLHQYKTHARIEWQMLQQLGERLQTTGRRADTNDRES